MTTTNTKPPIEIFDVLHDAEKAGVELEQSIYDWWFQEIFLFDENLIDGEKLTNKGSKIIEATAKPPIEIFDVLHEAEKMGIELPEAVDDWWFLETENSEAKKDSITRRDNEREKNS